MDKSDEDTRGGKVAGEKRSCPDVEDEENLEECDGLGIGKKRVKMRDLKAVLRSDCVGNRGSRSENAKAKESLVQLELGRAERTSQTAKENEILVQKDIDIEVAAFRSVKTTILSDRFQPVINRCSSLSAGAQPVAGLVSGFVDYIKLPNAASNGKLIQDNETNKLTSPSKLDEVYKSETGGSPVLNLNLNAIDESNMADYNPFHPFKKLDQKISTAPSECASTTGPSEVNSSLKMWNEMKQNGFLSLAHGGIPLPKKRGRQAKKRKEDELKKKMDFAKREHANRFAKVVAPSGLLSGLNPGIINHVRNGKQVRSIIEAMVRSETLEKQKKGQSSRENLESDGSRTDTECTQNSADNKGDDPSSHRSDFLSISRRSYEDSRLNTEEVGLPQESNIASRLSVGHRSYEDSRLNTKDLGLSQESNIASRLSVGHESDEDSRLNTKELGLSQKSNIASRLSLGHESDEFTLKLSSRALASETASQTSNDEISESKETLDSLSMKGASVAFQWLELLRQDIKGRLAALKRSRKRVRNAIQTELPYLLQKGHTPNQENIYPGQSLEMDPSSGMHMIRWKILFNKMEKELVEEGKHLETWLGQVTEMLGQCDSGLRSVFLDGMPLVGSSDKSRFQKIGAFERKSAVKAAAASIYSTCTLAMSKENVPCF